MLVTCGILVYSQIKTSLTAKATLALIFVNSVNLHLNALNKLKMLLHQAPGLWIEWHDLGYSPGQGHMLFFRTRNFTLTVPLPTRNMGTCDFSAGGNSAMEKHPTHWCFRNTSTWTWNSCYENHRSPKRNIRLCTENCRWNIRVWIEIRIWR